MMYPFLQLNDLTEIVHSEMHEDGCVKVYIEKPVEGGFCSAICWLPGYRWESVEGFDSAEIARYHEIVESVAHLIMRFSQEGGFENAANL